MYELDKQDLINNGFINDDLIVWMREAAFPNFKKLYGVLYRDTKPFTTGLPAGNYRINISYSILSLLTAAWVKVCHACPIASFVLSPVKRKHVDRDYFRTAGRLFSV